MIMLMTIIMINIIIALQALGTLTAPLGYVALLCTGGLMCSRHRCGEESASINRTEVSWSCTH